jgi:ATP-dependent protease ClpP protease subunit
MRPRLNLHGTIVTNDWGESGYVSSASFRAQLNAIDPAAPEIELGINSIGGNVLEGFAIYNMLVNHGARIIVNIEGSALSMGSIIAMAGDEIHMPDTAFMMIHEPHSVAYGTAEDFLAEAAVLEKMFDTLANVYAARTGSSLEEIKNLMTAETWMNGAEAKKFGFVTHNSSAKTAPTPNPTAQHVMFNQFKNAPAQYLNSLNPAIAPLSTREIKPSSETPPTPNPGQKAGHMENAVIAAALGLPSTATDAEILVKTQQLNAGSSAILSATGQSTLDAAQGHIIGLQAKAEKADKLEQTVIASQRIALLEKIPPAARERLASASLEAVQAAADAYAEMPGLNGKKLEQKARKTAPEAKLTAEEMVMAKQMGVTPEAMLAQKIVDRGDDSLDDDDGTDDEE